MTELREFSEHICAPLLMFGYLPGTLSSDSCTRVPGAIGRTTKCG